MNEADRRFLRDFGDQIGSTLDENYELIEKLPRVPICVACPMAQWYLLESPPSKPALQAKPDAEAEPPRLECFCTAFRTVMYNGGRVVKACDARIDALKEPPDPA